MYLTCVNEAAKRTVANNIMKSVKSTTFRALANFAVNKYD
jgi:hypothetical protein